MDFTIRMSSFVTSNILHFRVWNLTLKVRVVGIWMEACQSLLLQIPLSVSLCLEDCLLNADWSTQIQFLVLNQTLLVDAFHNFPGLSKPHSTVKYAIKTLLGLGERKSGDVLDGVAEQIRNLRKRSKRLKDVIIFRAKNFPLCLFFIFNFSEYCSQCQTES